MKQYKLQKDYTNETCAITIVGENISIPLSPGNKEYEEYLKWLAEGNTPLPADE